MVVQARRNLFKKKKEWSEGLLGCLFAKWASRQKGDEGLSDKCESGATYHVVLLVCAYVSTCGVSARIDG